MKTDLERMLEASVTIARQTQVISEQSQEITLLRAQLRLAELRVQKTPNTDAETPALLRLQAG